MTFDNSLSLNTIVGVIATLFVSALGALAVYARFGMRQSTDLSLLTREVMKLTGDISELKDTIKILAEQTIRTALLEQDRTHQNERIARLERKLDELQHGEGMVLPLHGRNKTAFGEG